MHGAVACPEVDERENSCEMNWEAKRGDKKKKKVDVLWWMVTDVMFDLLRGEVASVDTTACPEVTER